MQNKFIKIVYVLIFGFTITVANGFGEANNAYKKGNYAKAAKLFEKACDAGSAKECGYLGLMYFKGLSVNKDYFKAIKFYKKACKGGYVAGCGNLGLMYYIKADYTKAIKLFKQTCSSGSSSGCIVLGTMQYKGEGVVQNKNEALKLFARACAMKSKLGCKTYAKLKKEMDQ